MANSKDLEILKKTNRLDGGDLSGANLTDLDLSRSIIKNTNMENVIFSDSKNEPSSSFLMNCTWENVNLTNVNISIFKLWHCTWDKINFTNSILIELISGNAT